MADPLFNQPLRLLPWLVERPWGGRCLATELGKPLPSKGSFGESWEVADLPDGRSMIADGPYKGAEFGELLRRYPQQLCALERAPDRYPLLVKFLDVRDHLSLQVHPSDEHVAGSGDRGKTECWYVMQCDEGAELIVGLHEQVSRETLFEALHLADPEPRLNELMQRIQIAPGSFLHVPAGTVHAILGGCVICEVQQASNLTYRLWDWNREPARPLHIEEGLRVIRFGVKSVAEHWPTSRFDCHSILVSNMHFEVRLAVFSGSSPARLALENPHGMIACVVSGSGAWSVETGGAGHFHVGEAWYLPPSVKQLGIQAGTRDLRLLLSRSLELG